jgi:hypothetical protein
VKLGLSPQAKNTHRVFEHRVLRIFGFKNVQVIRGWRKLHNEELHYLCFSPDIISMMKTGRMIWTEHVACTGEMRNTYSILFLNLEGKNKLLGRAGSTCV